MKRDLNNMFNIQEFDKCKIVFMFDDSELMYAIKDDEGYRIMYDDMVNHNIIYKLEENTTINDFYYHIENHLKRQEEIYDNKVTIVNAKYLNKDQIISLKAIKDKVEYVLKSDKKYINEIEDASGFISETLEVINGELLQIAVNDNLVHETIYKDDKDIESIDSINYENLIPIKEQVYETTREMTK